MSKKPTLLNEQEESVLLEHDYDGIHEFNYPLPSWWTTLWVASIIFSIPYFMYYHMSGGPSLNDELSKEMAQIEKLKTAAAQDVSSFSLDQYQTWTKENTDKEMGKTVFEENCMSCHEAGGKGDIGPNLTDNYWLHGTGTEKDLFELVRDGVEDNGMPAWGEIISKQELFAVINYIKEIKGTNPPGAKEPQGKLVE